MYEKPTVKIKDVTKPGDYVVIAKDDFDPAEGHQLFSGGPPLAAPDHEGATKEMGSSDFPVAALIAEGLAIPVARLGPWLAERESVELLVRMLDLETRASAKTVITARISALTKAKQG